MWAHENLITNSKVIETTPEHLFFAAAGLWVDVGELEPDDPIYDATGRTGRVEGIELVSQPQVMYNLTVAEAHTFFVGVGRWLVHNANDCYATIGVDMVRGTVENPFEVLQNAANLARSKGARTLFIRGIPINPQLEIIMRRRYNFVIGEDGARYLEISLD